MQRQIAVNLSQSQGLNCCHFHPSFAEGGTSASLIRWMPAGRATGLSTWEGRCKVVSKNRTDRTGNLLSLYHRGSITYSPSSYSLSVNHNIPPSPPRAPYFIAIGRTQQSHFHSPSSGVSHAAGGVGRGGVGGWCGGAAAAAAAAGREAVGVGAGAGVALAVVLEVAGGAEEVVLELAAALVGTGGEPEPGGYEPPGVGVVALEVVFEG